MTGEMALLFAITLAAIVMFVKAWFTPDAVALFVLVALVVGRLLPAREAFQSFGNEALVTVAAMFVLSAGLIRTGAVNVVGRRILAFGKGSERRILFALMLTTAGCSAFMNNTPIAVIFLPIVLGIAEDTGLAGSRLLIPMSYATIVGGMSTVIGTSTNVLVSSALPALQKTFPGHDMSVPLFGPLPLALAGLAMTTAYVVLLGPKLLPSRVTVTSTARGGKIAEYMTEVAIPAGSPYVGKTLEDAVTARSPGVRVLQVIRDGEILPPRSGATTLQAGDALLVKGDVNDLLALHRSPGIAVAPELGAPAIVAQGKSTTLAELLVRPTSAAIGGTVREQALHERYGVVVLAVQRHGTHIRQKVADVRLRMGDVLLIQSDAPALEALRGSPDFVLLEGVEERVLLPHRAGIALGVVAAVVLLAAFDVERISILALMGALGMVAGRCLTVREAYRAIDVPLLVLIAGTIALGQAMERTEAARFLADGLVAVARPLGDVALLAAIYLACNLLTALISNAAAALLVLPIGLAAAKSAHLQPMPFVMAVMFAASIDFSTPIGYQTNTFVYGPGGYRFSDYVKFGGPLNLLWWILCTLMIPVLWPLH